MTSGRPAGFWTLFSSPGRPVWTFQNFLAASLAAIWDLYFFFWPSVRTFEKIPSIRPSVRPIVQPQGSFTLKL
jgi:hypothetical protein